VSRRSPARTVGGHRVRAAIRPRGDGAPDSFGERSLKRWLGGEVLARRQSTAVGISRRRRATVPADPRRAAAPGPVGPTALPPATPRAVPRCRPSRHCRTGSRPARDPPPAPPAARRVPPAPPRCRRRRRSAGLRAWPSLQSKQGGVCRGTYPALEGRCGRSLRLAGVEHGTIRLEHALLLPLGLCQVTVLVAPGRTGDGVRGGPQGPGGDGKGRIRGVRLPAPALGGGHPGERVDGPLDLDAFEGVRERRRLLSWSSVHLAGGPSEA
jgi:hypothetical protein